MGSPTVLKRIPHKIPKEHELSFGKLHSASFCGNFHGICNLMVNPVVA